MRHRASDLATQYLGPRTELELARSQQREVEQERWTSLDRALQRQVDQDGVIDTARPGPDRAALRERSHLIGRLQFLERAGLAEAQGKGVWKLHRDAESILRTMGERNDILKTMQRALCDESRPLAIWDPKTQPTPVIGRVVGRGYVDEFAEQSYFVVDAIDGRAYHVPGGSRDPAILPMGAVVKVQPSVSRADSNIAAVATPDGNYFASSLRNALRSQFRDEAHAEEVLEAHERRLEALRRAGIVQREARGCWRVPNDLVARGAAYDQAKTGGLAIEILSDLPLDRQVKAMGATWLDRQLTTTERSIVDSGFGESVNTALRNRAAFLIEQGYARQEEGVLQVPRSHLTDLRQRELKEIADRVRTKTGQLCRVIDGDGRASGTYRQTIVAASGRFALLDDGLGFSLVPWRPDIEQQFGRSISVTVRGSFVSWTLGRERGLSL